MVLEPAKLATECLTLVAIISLSRLAKEFGKYFYALLSPASQAPKSNGFNPKLAKPRMGLHSAACIRRLIEGWIPRSRWVRHEMRSERSSSRAIYSSIYSTEKLYSLPSH
jgi:hypothetical protein